MLARLHIRSLPLLLLAAALAGLLLAGEARAQKGAADAAKKAAEAARKAEEAAKNEAEKKAKAEANLVKQEMNGKMSEAIKEIYILVSAANKDYGGHRGKAMHHIEEAAKIMDSHILAHGSVAQKVKAIQEDQAAGRAKAMDKYNVPVKEGQVISDALLVQAHVLLKQLAPTLVRTNHPGVLGEVEKAIGELELALTVR